MAPLGGEAEETTNRPPELHEEEERWGKRLVASKKFQAQYSAGWDENKRLIFSEISTGKEASGQGTPPWATGGANQVAYGWGLYEGLETSIYVQTPEIIASAHDPSMQPVARRVTKIVNYDFDQMNVKDIGNLCLLDTFICGYGAVIEGVESYHVKDEEGKNTGDLSGQEFEIRRIAPLDILFDKGSRRLDLSDCKYIFTAWYPTIDQLKNDPNITDLPEDVDEWPECNEYTRANFPQDGGVSERQSSGQGAGQAGSEKDPSFRTVCVWEVYDKVNHEVLYLTDYFKHYIIGRAPWPANLRFGCRDMFPQTLLYSHPVPGRFYPRPEAELIAPQLREINIVERIISEQSRTKRRKQVTWAGLLSEDQKAKVNDTSVANDLMFLDGTKLQDALGLSGPPDSQLYNINNVVGTIEEIKPPQDLIPRYSMLQQEIQHIVGYGPADRGGLPSTRSAREAMMINQRQDARLDKRKSRIEDFNRLLAQKHIRFLQKYASVERYAKLFPDVEGMEEWIKYGRQDIQGDFEFDVVTGTSTPKTTEVKRASELSLFQAISPVLMQSGLSVRPAFERLAEYYEWDGIDQLFQNVKGLAKQTAVGLAAFSKGQLPPEGLLNLVSQLIKAELSPQEFQMLAKQMAGGPPAQSTAMGQSNTPRGDPNPGATTRGVE